MTTAAICATREVSWSPSFYRGEQYDADLGLYYLRARYYNPATGRFLSRDPEDGQALDPKTLHKYLYAGADPVNAMDPTGRGILEVGSIDAVMAEGTFPGIVAFAGTQAANAAVALGVQELMAGLSAAAEAGSWEDAVSIMGRTAKLILQSKPIWRGFLCAPVGWTTAWAISQLDEFAKANDWPWVTIKLMDISLKYADEGIIAVCTGSLAFGGAK
jgi:RHS repeat-associated protein